MRVVHCKREKYTVYIGRPSVLGNPYVIGKDGNRAEVIHKFEQYARDNDKVLRAIDELQEDDVIGCWCSPHACHGDVIVKIWRERKHSLAR
jgi:hypothetical protein